MSVSTAVDPNAVARVVGIQQNFTDLRGGRVVNLPMNIALIGQGNTAATYSTTKQQVFSAVEVGQLVGFGSPLHIMASQVLPANGDGVGSIPVTIFPLLDDASGAPSVGNILPSGAVTKAGSFVVNINDILSAAFTVEIGDTVADICDKIVTAVNANVSMPVTPTDNTTDVDLTSKWEGVSANSLTLSVDGPTDTGVTFGLTQPIGGLVNPDVQTALDQFGDVWYTLAVNAMEETDTTSLDTINTFGEGRWGALVRKPFVCFTGAVETDVNTIKTIPDARKSQFVNSYATAPGSNNFPAAIAARAVSRIAVLANANPPTDYGAQRLSGISQGLDSEQWTYPQRDTLVKSGVSTSEVKDSVVTMSDTVTFYHPDGDPTPAYRYVVDIIKIMNIIFNVDLIFTRDDWNGAPLIPDEQPTTNSLAKKPKMAKAEVNALIDNLGLGAIISDPETAKKLTLAQINSSNPKRLDVALTVQISGNSNIISVDLNWGFYFGTNQLVA